MGNCVSIFVKKQNNKHIVIAQKKNSCVHVSLVLNSFLPSITIEKYTNRKHYNYKCDKNSIRAFLLYKCLSKIIKTYNVSENDLVEVTVPRCEVLHLQSIGFQPVFEKAPYVDLEIKIQEFLDRFVI